MKLLKSANVCPEDERIIYVTVGDLNVANIISQLKKVMGYDFTQTYTGNLKTTINSMFYNSKKRGQLDSCFYTSENAVSSLTNSYEVCTSKIVKDKNRNNVHHDLTSCEKCDLVNHCITTQMDKNHQKKEAARQECNHNILSDENDKNTNNNVTFETHQNSKYIDLYESIDNTKLTLSTDEIVMMKDQVYISKPSPTKSHLTDDQNAYDSTKVSKDNVSKNGKKFKNCNSDKNGSGTNQHFKYKILQRCKKKPKQPRSRSQKYIGEKIDNIQRIHRKTKTFDHKGKEFDFFYGYEMFENKGIVYHYKGRDWKAKTVGDNYYRKCFKNIKLDNYVIV